MTQVEEHLPSKQARGPEISNSLPSQNNNSNNNKGKKDIVW
jgi:hypothetical protein